MKTQTPSARLITFSLLVLLSATVEAVLPPPDGGYPGGNTAEGQNALLSLTSGGFNTAVGFMSLRSNATGQLNTAIGAATLLANTADQNTATGAGALLSNTPARKTQPMEHSRFLVMSLVPAIRPSEVTLCLTTR